MDPQYASRYRELYQRHWWWRARERFVVETLRRFTTARPTRILDVGCGDGLLFERLAEFGEVSGVESDPSVVPADSPHRGRIHVGAFDSSFRPEVRYGLILMLDVLEHMADRPAALRRAVDLLEADGALVVTVPAFPSLWTTHDDLNRHYERYTRGSLTAVAVQNGLRVELARYFFHWLFAAKLVVRVFEKSVRRPPVPPRLPPNWLNALLYGCCRLEQRLFTPLALPFGSSLLVVARQGRSRVDAREDDAAMIARSHFGGSSAAP